jgi:chemotaxis protein CheD
LPRRPVKSAARHDRPLPPSMSIDLPQESSYYLRPGYIYCSLSPATVRTVVGSCVSVCIWDQHMKYGAMNHFRYPATNDPAQATPIYGNVATAELIRMMLEGGSRKEDLVAQIVGGACPDPERADSTGSRNVEAARLMLGRGGVQVRSEDTGGQMGRKIVFDTGTGHITILKVHRIRDEDWDEKELAPEP